MNKFQRTSFTPRNELLTTPRWANTLPGAGMDGDIGMDLFDKVEGSAAMQRVPSAPTSGVASASTGDEKFLPPSGRMSTTHRGAQLSTRNSTATDNAINAVVAIISQVESNSSAAEALLGVSSLNISFSQD